MFTGGKTGEGKIPSGKAGTYSKLMPIFIMFTFKERNIGADPRSGVIYMERGMFERRILLKFSLYWNDKII